MALKVAASAWRRSRLGQEAAVDELVHAGVRRLTQVVASYCDAVVAVEVSPVEVDNRTSLIS